MSTILGNATTAMSNVTGAPLSPEEMMEQGIKAALSNQLGAYLGPFMAGWYLDFIMFGIMVHQTVIWASNARGERVLVQAIVTAVTLSATAMTAYSMYYLWTAFVSGFGNYTNVVKIDKVLTYSIINPLIVIPVQIFYVERAYRINKNAIWIPLICLLGIGLGLAGAIGSRQIAQQAGNLEPMPTATKYLYMWIAGNLFVDFFVTCTMAYGLSKSKTGWSETDRLINRIIRASFETQIPGTVVSITFLIVYLFTASKASTASTFFIFVSPKVHVIPFLAVLNYRYTLRQELTMDNDPQSGVKRSNTFALSNRHQQQTQMDEEGIKVDTVTYQESHILSELPIGLNRTRQARADDEESAHSAHSDGTIKSRNLVSDLKEDDTYAYINSSTMLHRPVFQK